MAAEIQKKILYWGNLHSPFIREQIKVAIDAGYGVLWYWHSPSNSNLEGAKMYSLPAFLRNNIVLRVMVEPFFLFFLLRKYRPDLIHVFYAMKGISPWALPKGTCMLVSVMGSDVELAFRYKRLYYWFTHSLLKRANRIISKSEYMDQRIREIDEHFNEKLVRITWGVDLDQFNPNIDVTELRSKLNIPSDGLVFFDPRSARAFYKKHVILRAFGQYVHASGRKQDRLLVSEYLGTDEYLAELREIVVEFGIEEQVQFVGSISFDKMPAYYTLSDIVISIPPTDGLPQTIFEAFSCEAFVIAGNLPAYREIISDGKTAKLVDVDDILALQAAMHWVADNDEARRNAKILGRQYVEMYANKAKEELKLLDLYGEVLKR